MIKIDPKAGTAATTRQMPLAELNTDLIECLQDIGWCTIGLSQGIVSTEDGTLLVDRITGNVKIAGIILTELDRRGEDYPE